MANKDLKLTPHMKNSGEWWWYEEPKGIAIIFEGKEFLLSWAELRGALKRKDIGRIRQRGEEGK